MQRKRVKEIKENRNKVKRNEIMEEKRVVCVSGAARFSSTNSYR